MKPKLKVRLKRKVMSWYIEVRKRFLVRWTKISEENRTSFFSFISISFTYLQNALLMAVPIWLFSNHSYWKIVLCIWFALPFIEHYYVWFRESWKDNLLK